MKGLNGLAGNDGKCYFEFVFNECVDLNFQSGLILMEVSQSDTESRAESRSEGRYFCVLVTISESADKIN